ncbi:ferredoxin family protein [Chloroflexota bacterium]
MKYWRNTLDQESVKQARFRVHVERDLCKGCRFCIELCPRHVLYESAELNKKGYRVVQADDDNRCLNCGLCEKICPEFAIKVAEIENEND